MNHQLKHAGCDPQATMTVPQPRLDLCKAVILSLQALILKYFEDEVRHSSSLQLPMK